MDADKISHIGICVRNMHESLKFYRDALGMKVLGEKITDITEGGTQTGRLGNYKLERNTRHWISLGFSDNLLIPTLTLTSHPGEASDGQAIHLDQVGISHISFSVSDPKSVAEGLLSNGYEMAGSWEDFTDNSGRVRSLYMYDPDHMLVQFQMGGGS